jgi:hypothetical protein
MWIREDIPVCLNSFRVRKIFRCLIFFSASMLNTFAQDWIMSLEHEGNVVLYRLSDLPLHTSTLRQYVLFLPVDLIFKKNPGKNARTKFVFVFKITFPPFFFFVRSLFFTRYSNIHNVLPVSSSIRSIFGVIVRFGQQEEGVDFLCPSLLSLYFADGMNGCVELWNIDMDTKGRARLDLLSAFLRIFTPL